MNKIDLLYGFAIGLLCAFIGSFAFVYLFTDFTFLTGLEMMHARDSLGKLITLGAILNLIAFFLLLRARKDLMARGVILATIVLAIVTIVL